VPLDAPVAYAIVVFIYNSIMRVNVQLCDFGILTTRRIRRPLMYNDGALGKGEKLMSVGVDL